MTDFLINNMAPIIFASMVMFMLVGFPVAFALAANGVVFGLIGIDEACLARNFFKPCPIAFLASWPTTRCWPSPSLLSWG